VGGSIGQPASWLELGVHPNQSAASSCFFRSIARELEARSGSPKGRPNYGRQAVSDDAPRRSQMLSLAIKPLPRSRWSVGPCSASSMPVNPRPSWCVSRARSNSCEVLLLLLLLILSYKQPALTPTPTPSNCTHTHRGARSVCWITRGEGNGGGQGDLAAGRHPGGGLRGGGCWEQQRRPRGGHPGLLPEQDRRAGADGARADAEPAAAQGAAQRVEREGCVWPLVGCSW